MDESDFAEQLASAIEDGMDVDEVAVHEEQAKLRIIMMNGDVFSLRVTKTASGATEEPDDDDELDEPEEEDE